MMLLGRRRSDNGLKNISVNNEEAMVDELMRGWEYESNGLGVRSKGPELGVIDWRYEYCIDVMRTGLVL
jgi:hypothetical protein